MRDRLRPVADYTRMLLRSRRENLAKEVRLAFDTLEVRIALATAVFH